MMTLGKEKLGVGKLSHQEQAFCGGGGIHDITTRSRDTPTESRPRASSYTRHPGMQ